MEKLLDLSLYLYYNYTPQVLVSLIETFPAGSSNVQNAFRGQLRYEESVLCCKQKERKTSKKEFYLNETIQN